jgi:hypothetical protein
MSSGLFEKQAQRNKFIHKVPINGDVEDDILDASTFTQKLLVSHIDKLLNICMLLAHVGAIIMSPKNKITKKKLSFKMDYPK